MRLPAASTPMSFIVTPASARAASAASAPRSTTSLSGCLPNLVIVMPRIQMSSAMVFPSVLDGLEAEADGLGALAVGRPPVGGEGVRHAVVRVVRLPVLVVHVAADAGAVAVDVAGDEGDG